MEPRTRTLYCVQPALNDREARMPAHGRGSCGARQRKSPTGGRANGMAFHAIVPSASGKPCTRPKRVWTTWSPFHAPGSRREPTDGADAQEMASRTATPHRAALIRVWSSNVHPRQRRIVSLRTVSSRRPSRYQAPNRRVKTNVEATYHSGHASSG